MCCLGMVDRQETSHNLQSAGGGRKAEDFGFLNSSRERNPNEVMDNRDRVGNVVDVGTDSYKRPACEKNVVRS